jgi:hypothetical protein
LEVEYGQKEFFPYWSRKVAARVGPAAAGWRRMIVLAAAGVAGSVYQVGFIENGKALIFDEARKIDCIQFALPLDRDREFFIVSKEHPVGLNFRGYVETKEDR